MEEELEQEEQKVHRAYKIMEGDTVFIKRDDIVSKTGIPYTFYSINIPIKIGEKKENYKKEIQFKQGVDLKDNTKIKILNMFEKVRINQRDRFTPVWGLFINDFEIVDEPNYYEMQNEFEDYQSSDELNEDGIVEVNW